MKKSIAFFLMIACSIIFTSCSKSVKPYRVGLVNSVAGEVQIIGINGAKTPAKPGVPVDTGMKVKTVGKKSMCEIYFNDNVVKIFGDSEINVEWLTFNMKTKADETAIIVNNGRVFAKVARKLMKDDAFVIKTNTTVAAVRGTEFFVSSKGTASNVSCLDGKIEVRNKIAKNDPVIIADREESTSVKGKKPTKKVIQPKTEKALKTESKVNPVTKSNEETFKKLNEGDDIATKNIRESVKKMSGSEPEKIDKHNIDIFFFKG